MLDFNAIKFLLVALNLLILYFVLRKILFKRVTEFMENRTNEIRNSIESAEKSKVEAAQLKKSYEDRIREAKDEAEKIITEARIKAEKEYDGIVASAKKDAEDIILKAREETERERQQMLKGIRDHVAGLALSAASKVVEANLDTEGNRKLVEKFIDEAGAA